MTNQSKSNRDELIDAVKREYKILYLNDLKDDMLSHASDELLKQMLSSLRKLQLSYMGYLETLSEEELGLYDNAMLTHMADRIAGKLTADDEDEYWDNIAEALGYDRD